MTPTTTVTGNGHNFPVIFNDGDNESDIGNILVSTNTDFKSFLTRMSSKIGISPHQFTIFLKHKNQPHRKIPISSKINFSTILQDTNYYFLVSLKRSAKYNHKTTKSRNKSSFLSSNVVLLRRGQGFAGVYEMKLKGYSCEECLKGNGRDFHRCVTDAVILDPRFMSPAGPIARPVKKQH